MSFFGVFQLPESVISRKFPSVSKIYTGFIFLFFGTLMTLTLLSVIVAASKDLIEFSMNITERVLLSSLFIEVTFINEQRNSFLALVDQMKKFDVFTYPIIFIKSRYFECLSTAFYMASIILFILINNIEPFLPLDDKAYEYFQTIYGYKNPQYRLSITLWIPFVDTSELRWFIPLYFVDLYGSFLIFVMSGYVVLFPIIILHFVGQHIILSYKLKSLGRSAWDKDWMRNQAMATSSRMTWDRQNQIKRARDVFQIKSCILFHQRLLRFRKSYDSITRGHFDFRAVVYFSTVCLSTYNITVLSHFDFQRQSYLVVEFFMVISVYYGECFVSEVFEWANERIRRSIYQSNWYEMCPEAQRMMMVFLALTQRPHHIRCLGGMVILGNENFVKCMKSVYSVIQFAHIVNKK
ncbi:hypothetical protein WDU94_009895 [Cyamophila willieti]